MITINHKLPGSFIVTTNSPEGKKIQLGIAKNVKVAFMDEIDRYQQVYEVETELVQDPLKLLPPRTEKVVPTPPTLNDANDSITC